MFLRGAFGEVQDDAGAHQRAPWGCPVVWLVAPTGPDVVHRICPRRRISRAPAVVMRAAAARNGWTGANHVIAPEYPNASRAILSVSYTHLRAHETDSYLVCR